MDEEDKARLARQALEAADLLKPGEISERVKSSVAEGTRNVALRGMAAIARMTGSEQERPASRARAADAVDLTQMVEEMDAEETAAFERRLAAAMSRKREQSAAGHQIGLAELRQSFPEPAKQLALLVFNCVDLLEDLSSDVEGAPPPPEELARKERLMTRISELLAPRASEALLSFVEHVVTMSRRHREG